MRGAWATNGPVGSDEGTLSHRLRSGTHTAHRSAERSAFMRALLAGRLTVDAYCALLRSLRAVYGALEEGLERHRAHPAVAAVYDARLARVDALDRDLVALGGARVEPAPEADAYATHVADIAGRSPHRLVAHAYVRYLGDLSGGQIIDPIVRRSIEGAAASGRAFYDFGDADTVRELATKLRTGLDAIDHALHDDIVDEALVAFGLHESLFAALEDQRSRIDRMRS